MTRVAVVAALLALAASCVERNSARSPEHQGCSAWQEAETREATHTGYGSLNPVSTSMKWDTLPYHSSALVSPV